MENINVSKKSKEMQPTTTEDFQTKLCVWFEEKGVLAELRAHLRHQMIESLKTSDIGRKMSFEKRRCFSLSPKYQAINLLIAEYLSCQGYQYSMSVFSSEVGTLHSLPHCTQDNEQLKFQNRDACDILESLGLPLDCEESQYISSIYNERNGDTKQCLLLCLLRTLPTILWSKLNTKKGQNEPPAKHYNNTSIKNEEATISQEEHQTQRLKHMDQEIEENLQGILFEVHNNMQQAFDHELKIAKEEEKHKYLKLLQEIENEMQLQRNKERTNNERSEKRMRENLLRDVESEKSRLQDEYRLKEVQMEREVARELEVERYKMLNEYRQVIESKTCNIQTTSPSNANVLEMQSSYLNMALDKVQKQSNKLMEKEELFDKRLKQMEEKLKNKQKAVEYKEKLLNEERDKIRKAKEQLDLSLIRLEGSRTTNESSNKEVQTDHPMVAFCTTDTQTDNVEDNNMLDSLMRTLHKENTQLKALTAKQNTKIEKLIVKQLNMSSEVTEARAQVQELSKQLTYLEGCRTFPLKMRNIGTSSNKSKNISRASGFKVTYKKHSKAFHNESSSDETVKGSKRYTHKKAMKKSQQDAHSMNRSQAQTNSEDSPTDEILNDAKRRLKLLELETEAMDRSYQEFKIRQETEKIITKERKSTPIQCTNLEEFPKNDLCKGECEINGMNTYKHISSPYNTFRRVHQSTMNIDKNMLQSYLTANTIRCHHSLITHHHNNTLTLQKNTTTSPQQCSTMPRHLGTTALLLKRIENCTSNFNKFNTSNNEFITNNIFKSKRKLINQFTNSITNHDKETSQSTCYKSEDYSQYIGISSQQYKIKPTVHWKNIHKGKMESNKQLNLIKEVIHSPTKIIDETSTRNQDENKVESSEHGANYDLVKVETIIGNNELQKNSLEQPFTIEETSKILNNSATDSVTSQSKHTEEISKLSNQFVIDIGGLNNHEKVIQGQSYQPDATKNVNQNLSEEKQRETVSIVNTSPKMNLKDDSKNDTISLIDLSSVLDNTALQSEMEPLLIETNTLQTAYRDDTNHLLLTSIKKVEDSNSNADNVQYTTEDAFKEPRESLSDNMDESKGVDTVSALSSKEASANSSGMSVPRDEDDDNFWM